MTRYVTGFVKSFVVTPLVWGTPPTLTDAPVVANVATRCARSVPEGTVTAMVCAVSSIVPTAAGLRPWKLKAVMALAVEGPPLSETVTT